MFFKHCYGIILTCCRLLTFLSYLGGGQMAQKTDKTDSYRTAKISDEAYRCLRVAAALMDMDMRDVASKAIVDFCQPILDKGIHEHQLKIEKQLKKKK